MTRPSVAELDAATAATALAKLSEGLRELGFSEARVLAFYGWSHISAMSWAERRLPTPLPAAADLIALFTAGHALPVDRADKAVGEWLAPLLDSGLVERDAGTIRARIRLLPIGRSLLPCDLSELGGGGIAVPDDSTFHLLGCLPDSIGSWLDVGTGNGALFIARQREAATGTDVDERSLAFARLASHLNGRQRDRVVLADGCDIDGHFDLVTFNAPLPAHLGKQPTAYRRSSDPELLERFWTTVRTRVTAGGEVLVHSWLDSMELPPGLSGGEIVIARYSDNFGIVRWRPDAEGSLRRVDVPLSRHRAHLRRLDLD